MPWSSRPLGVGGFWVGGVLAALCGFVVLLTAAESAGAARNGPLAFGVDFEGCEPYNPFPEGCDYVFSSGVFTIAPGGQALRRLRAEQWTGGASFSRDGRRLVYATQGLYTLSGSGKGSPQAVPNTAGAQNPVWSPGGRRLAFDDQGSVFMIRADGSDRRLLGSGSRAAWSSAGWIGFNRGSEVLIVRANGTGMRVVAELEPNALVKDLDWSPDGEQLAIATQEGPHACANYSVCVVDIAAGNLRGAVPARHSATSIAWSPRGDAIAYDGYRMEARALYLVRSRGGLPRRILDEGRLPHREGSASFLWLAWRPRSR